MPKDSSGKFHMNPQLAKMHDKPKEHAAPNSASEQPPEAGVMEVHDHGDGSFHTMKDGVQEEHPDLNSVHANLDKHFGGDMEEMAEEEMHPGLHADIAKADSGGY